MKGIFFCTMTALLLLAVRPVAASSLVLSWTAAGDDNHTGTAYRYDLRYSTDRSVLSDWDYATVVPNMFFPASAGNREMVLVSNLAGGQTYFFAIKTIDELNNCSAISNIVETMTPMEADICTGILGNANCDPYDKITIGDLSALTSYLYGIGPLYCFQEADLNQSGGLEPQRSDLSIGDVAYLINYLFVTGPTLAMHECL